MTKTTTHTFSCSNNTCANCAYLSELGVDGDDTGRCTFISPASVVDTDMSCDNHKKVLAHPINEDKVTYVGRYDKDNA